MTVYVAEIKGRGIAAFHADNGAEAERLVRDRVFRDDLMVLASNGLANVIPHRYVLSTDGRLGHGFDGLGASEREEYYRILTLPLPTIEDSERCNELSSCGFTVNLPPLHTVQPLLRGAAWSCRRAAWRWMLGFSFGYWNLPREHASQLSPKWHYT